MLDLNHPQTQYIFEASAIEDALKTRALQMSVLPSAKRLPLLEQCHYGLDELRRLNRDHFENSAFIAQTLDEAEAALNGIAQAGEGKIIEDHSNGEGNCAVCGTPITKFWPGVGPRTYFIILCHPCNKPFMKAKEKLESPEGFGTCFI